MKKLCSFLLLFLAIFAYSAPKPTPEDVDAIYQKNKDSQFNYKGNIAVALNADLAAVIYDKNNKLDSKDYIKFDPYLGLYLIKSQNTLRASFMIDELDSKEDMWVMILDKNSTEMGHIKSFAKDIGELDELSYNASKAGLLVCDCGTMVGIGVGGNKFIGNRYIKHFMKYSDVYYGDIGVTFSDDNGTITVKSANPFGTGKELLTGDTIVSVNSKVPNNLREINEMILFAPKDAVLKFDINRDGKNQSYSIKMSNLPNKIMNSSDDNKTSSLKAKKPVKKRTFLSQYGITLNPNLTIKSVARNSKAYKAGFRNGDKIMQIDKKQLNSSADIEKIMSAKNGAFYYLVSRDDFQFFVKVYR